MVAQELGNEYVKFLKSGAPVLLTPFNIALALSLCNVQRMQSYVCAAAACIRELRGL